MAACSVDDRRTLTRDRVAGRIDTLSTTASLGVYRRPGMVRRRPMENAVMNLRIAATKNTLHSVPPIFASGDGRHGGHAPSLADRPGPTSKTPAQPADTRPGDHPLDIDGEENRPHRR